MNKKKKLRTENWVVIVCLVIGILYLSIIRVASLGGDVMMDSLAISNSL